MARRSQLIIATDDQRQALLTMQRSYKIEKRFSQRAEVILLSLEGHGLNHIMETTGLSRPVVNKWRQRFRALGLDGLKDAPRSGKPATISAEQKAMVIQKACEAPADGYTSWSQQRIAQSVGVSKTKVHTILKQAQLKAHKVDYWCGKSTDPEFESKMATIVGLYLDPPAGALVLCVDEKTQMQALDRSQPVLPLRPKAPKRLTATYKRNGTVSLVAALAVHTGEITAKPIERNTADNFLRFLKSLDRQYRHKTLHIIVDNLAVHKSDLVSAWLKGKRKIKLHYTPTYSSWLNQIEIWFNMLTRDVLKGGVWKSKQQLVEQLMTYVKTYNQTRAKPFAWTYTGNPLTIS